jgi:hypothetical protein
MPPAGYAVTEQEQAEIDAEVKAGDRKGALVDQATDAPAAQAADGVGQDVLALPIIIVKIK